MPTITVKDKTPAPVASRQCRPIEAPGPGLITSAADDDPSGGATYSQVGAQFGMAVLWTMLFSFPLMASMQKCFPGFPKQHHICQRFD